MSKNLKRNNKVRLFLGVTLSENISDRIFQFESEIADYRDSVKITPKQNLHITILFLGEQEWGVLEDIKTRVNLIKEKFIPFKVDLHSIGSFPGINSPRIIWVGCFDKNGELKKLYSEITNTFLGIKYKKAKNGFHPHITIGRVKKRLRGETIAFLNANKERSFGNLNITEITLFQSHLTPNGAQYKIIKTGNQR